MAIDPYQMCPCGSGKKIKFCCQAIIPEMEKIERLQEGKQYRTALSHVEALSRRHGDNPWVLITKAHLETSEQEWESARRTLEQLLQAHPEHGSGSILYAFVCYVMGGYEGCRPALSRAFLRAAATPSLAATLAFNVARDLLEGDRYLGARQYLTLALRLTKDDARKSVFGQLFEFETEETIPYPLRSVHPLQPWSGSEDANKEAVKGMRLTAAGCFDAAAKVFTALADRHPDAAALAQNAGLCRAFGGDDAAAAELLHRAARAHSAGPQPDRPAAVECETLAQLLDQTSTEDRVFMHGKDFAVGSVARLLTRISQHERFARDEAPAEAEMTDDEERPLAAAFDVLDRPPIEAETVQQSGLEALPRIVGWVRVYDAHPDRADIPPRVLLRAFEPNAAAVLALFTEVAGNEATPEPERPMEALGTGVPRELFPLERFDWFPMEGVPGVVRRRLLHERWQHTIEHVWSQAPQRALGDRSPRQAIGVPELSVPLHAALYVLEATAQARGYAIDLPELCSRYCLSELEPLPVASETPIHALSAMQLHRLPAAQLSDEQLRQTLNRAMLIHHLRFLHGALVEAVRRPELFKTLNMEQVFSTLGTICRRMGRRDEALEWIARALEWSRTQPNPFEQAVKWEMMELALRCDDPDDPELPGLYHRIMSVYAPKLPSLDQHVMQIFALNGISPPESLLEAEPGGALVGAGAGAGLWTPGGAAESGPAKKIWLPGQK